MDRALADGAAVSGLRRLAELYQSVEQETPFGGRSVGLEPVGVVWIEILRRRRRERSEAGVEPRKHEAIDVESRTDPRLSVGRVLRLDGADWRIVLIADDAPKVGRATLTLERES